MYHSRTSHCILQILYLRQYSVKLINWLPRQHSQKILSCLLKTTFSEVSALTLPRQCYWALHTHLSSNWTPTVGWLETRTERWPKTLTTVDTVGNPLSLNALSLQEGQVMTISNCSNTEILSSDMIAILFNVTTTSNIYIVYKLNISVEECKCLIHFKVMVVS